MHLLGSLGIDIWLLVAQIVNFLFLLWVLNKLVYQPIIKRIESDEASLIEVKKAQVRLEVQEQKFEQKNKQLTTRVKNRTKEIISEAEEMASAIRQNAQDEADSEKKAVIAQIKQRLAEVSHDE